MSKSCTKCLKTKELSEFPNRAKSKDGLNYWCKDCCSTTKLVWYENNREKARLSQLLYLENNKEKVVQNRTRYNTENRDKKAAWSRDWVQKNPAKVKLRSAGRREIIRRATPSWVSSEQWDEMNEFYARSRECRMLTGDLYHVDHIVPIKGKNVCGLNVPWNLQILPQDINGSKGTKYEGGW